MFFKQTRKAIAIDRVAAAIQKNKAINHWQNLANIDELTGLYNRRYFYAKLDEYLIDNNSGTSIKILYIDVDKFKAINDTYGHSIGDRALTIVAHRLSNNVREEDIIARVGGDEFCVLIKNENGAHVSTRKIIDRIKANLQNFEIYTPKLVTISCSIGESADIQHEVTPEILISSADEDLYKKKTELKVQTQ